MIQDELLGEVLEVVFTLRDCKGHKQDEHHDETIKVCTTKAEHSLLCSFRLVLALALRTQQVYTISAEEVPRKSQSFTERTYHTWSSQERLSFIAAGRPISEPPRSTLAASTTTTTTPPWNKHQLRIVSAVLSSQTNRTKERAIYQRSTLPNSVKITSWVRGITDTESKQQSGITRSTESNGPMNRPSSKTDLSTTIHDSRVTMKATASRNSPIF